MTKIKIISTMYALKFGDLEFSHGQDVEITFRSGRSVRGKLGPITFSNGESDLILDRPPAKISVKVEDIEKVNFAGKDVGWGATNS
jgi:hypothetical protein